MKAETIQINRKRWYPCPKCGDQHPSVTTLLDVISSPNLMRWSIKNGTMKLSLYHQVASEQLTDAVIQAIDKVAEQRWLFQEETSFWKSGSQIGDDAADYGKMAHAWIEAHLAGREIDLESLPPPSRNAVEEMLKWEKAHHLETIHTEKTFYNCKLNYAGTADFVGRLDEELSLGDWKTSAATYFSHVIQGWGYALADEIQNADRLYRQIFIGRFGKDGSSEVKIYKRNEFPSIETARDVLIACGHIFAALELWDRTFPYTPKPKGEITHA